VSTPPARIHVHPTGLDAVRTSLLGRRGQLEQWRAHAPEVDQLLAEVDAALVRLERGELGVCTVCHGEVEPERLLDDPLVSVCLDCLSPSERRLLEYDLELAAEVQASLAPPATSTLSGWDLAGLRRPRGPVGGDWCDLLPYRDGVLAVIGDVSGKGVSGALLAAQLQALFRAEADHGRDLAEMVARVNRLFCSSSPDQSYATLVAAHLDPAGGTRIVVAGHTPPLLRLRGVVRALDPCGPPVGIVCSAAYAPVEATLSGGDALLVVTDGISEAAAPDGSELGLDPLSRLLAAAVDGGADHLARTCVDLAAAHRAGAPAADDVTVFVARRGSSLA
jgi:sigma-B regulation protein RsbU (phosphoserine phosphatase)